MELNAAKKKHYRSLGHKLKPVVMIGDKGVTKGVDAELERALEDHELIKVKLNIPDPAARKALAVELCKKHKAGLVQAIGKIILIVRAAKKPSPKLSNLLRP
jgi:RNA-binding protein